ncbi:MAG TPA: FkbM family methyltransferase [Thermoplasmata archaeon]|nr:FkbM family methyltransferase [Thermoplasmata archaeon]
MTPDDGPPGAGATYADLLWATAGRVRDRLRGRWVWGVIEPPLLRIAPRVFPGPFAESTATGPGGIRFALPPHLPAARTYRAGRYEPQLTDWFVRSIRPGWTVVDGGANIGYYALIASRLAGPTGRVYAFEPDPWNFGYLARNLESNRCTNALPVPLALSDVSHRATFVRDRFGTEGHLSPGARRGPDAIEVGTTTLDAFLRERGWPGDLLIKLDLEGGEAPALRGMRETCLRATELRVILELSPGAIHRGGSSFDELRQGLLELGLHRARPIDGEGPEIRLESDPLRAASTVNLLALR